LIPSIEMPVNMDTASEKPRLEKRLILDVLYGLSVGSLMLITGVAMPLMIMVPITLAAKI
jgi:hypothetical protein